MKRYLLILLLPSFAFGEILDCKVEEVSRLYKDGTLGKHHLFEPLMYVDAQKHFSVNTRTGEISGGVILQNDRGVLAACSVKVTGGGDDDTVITSNCGGQVEHIRISTFEDNKPFVAVDFIRGVYSGICK
tara:strand:- start:796 stop:1185 length:390 start_codon:yes stop_codon:yes gene_type:complete